MSDKLQTQRLSANEVKAAAAGRWREILVAVAGIPIEKLDGKGHPCPACGGTDRFALIDEAAGAVLCRKCFAKQNGDGLAAVAWMLGCDFPAAFRMVAAYLGLTPTATIGEPRIVATFDYPDEEGKLLFQSVRKEPGPKGRKKTFVFRRPDPDGGWIWDLQGVRTIPYRLPELLADPTQPVVVVEGEKDVDNLARIGVLATCNPGGAGKWTVELSEFLRGRNVIAVPDNDKAGREHAEQVSKSLHSIAKSVRIVDLPGLPPKGDVSDWIEAGGTKGEFHKLADATAEWQQTAVDDTGPVLTCLANVEPCPVSWLWPGRIPLGRITLLAGRPGEGKSLLTTDMAAHVTTGTPWPDGSSCPQGSVILISAEDDPADTIRPRLDAHHADVRRVHLLSAVRHIKNDNDQERPFSLVDVNAIEVALARLPDCKLIVVDPIGSFLGGSTDAHRDNEVRAVLAPIAALAERYGIAVLVVAHYRKTSGNFADDAVIGSRAFTGIARAVWHLMSDPHNKARRLLLPGKNNLAHGGDGLAFSISGETPHIVWEPDPVEMNADEALAIENRSHGSKPGPVSVELDTALNFLESALAGGSRQSRDLLNDWENGQGGSKRTLDRAKGILKIESFRPEVPGPWWWRLPSKDAISTDGEERGNLGNLVDGIGDSTLSDAAECKDAKLQKPGDLGLDRVQVTI